MSLPTIPAIDFHVQVFPDRQGFLLGESRLAPFKKTLQFSAKPAIHLTHSFQTFYRIFPKELRKHLDRLVPLPTWMGTLIENSLQDLTASMKESNVEHAVLVAQPPQIENDFILEIARKNPQRFTAAVNIPPRFEKPAARLKTFHSQGAKILKIHPAIDGEGPDSLHYRALLKGAESLKMPVILHTGHIQSHYLFKQPELAEAQRYSNWFNQYPGISFVLAHMNFHRPEIAIDLAETHSNLWLDISWQPLETIVEAIRRVGNDRILFGSDWPYIGSNMSVMRSRIHEGVASGLIKKESAERILRLNALQLLQKETPHAPSA